MQEPDFPRDSEQSKRQRTRKRVSIKSILLSGMFMLLIATLVLLLIKQHQLYVVSQEYESLVEQQQTKQEQLEQFMTSLDTMTNKVEKVEEITADLQDSIGIESLRAVGGFVDTNNASLRLLRNKEEELVRDLWLRLQSLRVRVEEQEGLSQSLRNYLQKRAQLLSALPATRPVRGGWISSGFQLRKDPFTDQVRMHQGLDFSHIANTPVTATGSGVIIYAGYDPHYGKSIYIDHGFGFETRYAHLAKISIKVGDPVQRGDVIGLLGSTGKSTGPHVHYEVRIEGRPVNPFNFIYLLSES